MEKQIKSALISVYYKDGLEPIIKKLNDLGVTMYSTGGTQAFIEKMGIPVIPVEELTSYPSILGGRVKTLHPKIFGGILGRRELADDQAQLAEYEIPAIDLVLVNLYPFEETVLGTTDKNEIIEKIDIGGISLIRAAAKNFNDVVIVPSPDDYEFLLNILNTKNGTTSLENRRTLATRAFEVSSGYDRAIHSWFNQKPSFTTPNLNGSASKKKTLRYGENPHQHGAFFGEFDKMFSQLNGKELSYNNLLDIDAAVSLLSEFHSKTQEEESTFAILKHNNTCGLATRSKLIDAWKDALAGDPVSAFGGILICNRHVDQETAKEVHKLFFEVLIAPGFDPKALELLKEKKNRILLEQKTFDLPEKVVRTTLNGYLEQDRDSKTETIEDLNTVTTVKPTDQEVSDLLFANKIVKHTKSNTIVLAKNAQLMSSGVGQTSRVDALKQAILKAGTFGFDLKGAVMASDAFFPFPDCVQIAHEAGIRAVIQPGGSIKDKDSIDYCDQNGMAMVLTGTRHFKH